MFDVDYSPVGLPRLLVCGPLAPDEAMPRVSAAHLPRYQAVARVAEAAHSLPWITLPSALEAPAPEGPLSAHDRQALAEALEGTHWLLLVAGASPAAWPLAAAIAADARRHDAFVVTFVADAPTGQAATASLLPHSHALCHCPATVPPMLAAQVLWASVMCPGTVGVDFGDLRQCLDGEVHLHYAAPRHDGPGRVRTMLAQLGDIDLPRGLWAVLVLPDSCSLEEFTEVGDYLHECSGDDTSVVIALPDIAALPRGLYVFTCRGRTPE